MTDTNFVEPVMVPDYDTILQHLETLFGRALDGMIEIAWTDPNTKNLGAVPDNTFWCYEGWHEKESVKQRETGSPD